MRISEIFYSLQGEGKLVGVPSTFIRTSGCNLRCTWCDTPYTSWAPEGDELELDAILDRVADHPTRFVVLTGGEPMIQPQVGDLTRRLREGGYHLTIETAATVFANVACDLASLSPKLGNSTPWEREGGRFADAHERQRLSLDVIRRFIAASADYQLKFVVEQPADVREIEILLADLGDLPPENILLMPQAVSREELIARSRMLADLCKPRGWRFCPRLHIDLYGSQRGT